MVKCISMNWSDIGFVSKSKTHTIQKNLPISIIKPNCTASSASELKINWTEPIFPNGIIRNYEIR